MDLAHRDQILESLQKKSSEINAEMMQIGQIIQQKGGNKSMASARTQYDHYMREQIDGKQETLEAMHSLVGYLDNQIQHIDRPHLQRRAVGGRKRILAQMSEYLDRTKY